MSRDDITDNERKRFLSHINQQAKNLTAIVSDLLDISRIESGKSFTIDRGSCDIKKIINDAASYFESVSSIHRFDVTVPEDLDKFIVDSEKMEQVFTNIFSNAVKYSPGGGVVTVTGTVADDSCQISITDEGIGMTPEQAEKIFDKFYRADELNSSVSGTGLGMSIVKHIVDAHGGTVWVESEFGKGTTVHVSLPMNDKK
jgi:signal transduction histidine kinase